MYFNYSNIFLLIIFINVKVVHNLRVFNISAEGLPLFPPSCGYIAPICSASELFRRFDGSCTNPRFPERGVPGSEYTYLIEPSYQDGFSLPKTVLGGNPLPLARTIRNSMFPDGETFHNKHNVLAMTWGQFLTHDIGLLVDPPVDPVCCNENGHFQENMHPSCFAISIPPDDLKMAADGITCMNFTRAQTDFNFGCKCSTAAKPLNRVTAALDLSQVYGNSVQECNLLRTFTNGLLITEVRNGVELPPTTSSARPDCDFDFRTGDSRANQNAPLMALQTLFLREHNRLALKFSKINSHWNDQRIFMETRNIMIARYQHIVYYEWLPTIISEDILFNSEILFDTDGYVNDFRSYINLVASSEFSHACFRYFHANIPETFHLYNFHRNRDGEVRLADNIFCQTNLTKPFYLAAVTIGMTVQAMAGTDTRHVESITQFFRRPPGKKFGRDVRSMDIQRGRDMGLAPYSAYRDLCDVGPSQSFEDFSDFLSAAAISKLKNLYKRPIDVDLSTGGSVERHLPGSNVGPTFQCIIADQFQRLRQGDIFFYEHARAAFNLDQLASIRQTSSVARLFCNSVEGIDKIQKIGFQLINTVNPLVNCDTLPDIDLTLWKEYD